MTKTLTNSATAVPSNVITVLAIYEDDQGIMLIKNNQGKLQIPFAVVNISVQKEPLTQVWYEIYCLERNFFEQTGLYLNAKGLIAFYPSGEFLKKAYFMTTDLARRKNLTWNRSTEYEIVSIKPDEQEILNHQQISLEDKKILLDYLPQRAMLKQKKNFSLICARVKAIA